MTDLLPSWLSTRELAYLAAGWFALLALWCLVRYFRTVEADWLPEDDAMRARLYWQEERAGRLRSYQEPAAKSADAFRQGRVIHRMPPKDGAA